MGNGIEAVEVAEEFVGDEEVVADAIAVARTVTVSGLAPAELLFVEGDDLLFQISVNAKLLCTYKNHVIDVTTHLFFD